MSAFRPPFHITLANKFIEDVYYQRSNYYYFLGKLDAWDNEETPENDPIESYESDIEIRNNIVYLKKITSNDVSLVCRGKSWVKDTVYTQWDQTKDMQGENYFVINSEYNVYKCLNNNNGGKSTVEPADINYGVVKTDDGYLWKYLYTVPIVKRSKFLSSQYIPVQKALSDSFYSLGAVEGVTVTNEGNNYSTNKLTYAVVDKPKEGTQAKVTLYVNNITGSIDSVTVDERGSGYTSTPSIKVYDDSGVGVAKYSESTTAKLTAHILDGQLDSVTIDDPGVHYPSDMATTLTVSGDGEGCVLYPQIENGKIVGVVVSNAGSGYSYLDVTAVSSGSTGSGATFQAVIGGSSVDTDQAVVEQTAVEGAIYAIVIKEGGEQYSESTEVIIDGDGEGAMAHVQTENGKIIKVIMDSYGKGYSSVNISFSDPKRLEPNNYKDAVAYATLPPVGGHGYDAVSELYGDIFCIYVTVRDDDALVNLNQDYRQFGLIENPRDLFDKEKITSDDLTVSFKLSLLTSAELESDMAVYIDGVEHRVIGIEGNTVTVQQLCPIYHEITSYSSFSSYNEQTGITKYYEISEVLDTPDIDKYSGNLLYASNKAPFLIVSGRTFAIRTYIRF